VAARRVAVRYDARDGATPPSVGSRRRPAVRRRQDFWCTSPTAVRASCEAYGSRQILTVPMAHSPVANAEWRGGSRRRSGADRTPSGATVRRDGIEFQNTREASARPPKRAPGDGRRTARCVAVRSRDGCRTVRDATRQVGDGRGTVRGATRQVSVGKGMMRDAVRRVDEFRERVEGFREPVGGE
jgi:hypothetical protein